MTEHNTPLASRDVKIAGGSGETLVRNRGASPGPTSTGSEFIQPDRRCTTSYPLSGRCVRDAPYDGVCLPQGGRTWAAVVAAAQARNEGKAA